MKAPRLDVSRAPGASLSEATLDEMYGLRGRHMRLKPEVDPAVDRAKVTAFMREANVVFLGRDPVGVLRGMMSVLSFVVEGPAGRCRVVLPEYGMVDEPHRGDPGILRAYGRELVGLLRQPEPLFGGGAGYPASIMLGARLSTQGIYYWPDPKPALAELAIHAMAEKMCAGEYDPITGRAPLRTLPPEPPPWWLARMRRFPPFVRYEALCPDWREGQCTLVVFPITWGFLGRLVSRSVGRMVGRLVR